MKKEEFALELNPRENAHKNYLLANNGTFLMRFVNTAFGSKWCGIWHNWIKYIEYFATKVNDVWLGMHNNVKLIFDGAKAKHVFNLGDAKAFEEVVVGERYAIVRVYLEGLEKARVGFEVGVNTRFREENIHGRNYKLSFSDGVLEVKSSLGKIQITAEPSGWFEEINRKFFHRPGAYANAHGYDWSEEEQEKFVPGIYWVEIGKGEKVDFIINFGGFPKSFEKTYEEVKREIRIKTIGFNKPIELRWRLAQNLLSFKTKINARHAFFAGYPYFNVFWARDFLWSAKGLLHAGFWQEVEDSLILLAENAKNGEIPRKIWRWVKYEAADATPLWIIALYDYIKYSGNTSVLVDVRDTLVNAVLFGRNSLKNGFIEHNPKQTWMDSVERVKAVEVQALWAKAFELAGYLLGSSRLVEIGHDLKQSMLEFYFIEELRDAEKSPFDFTANLLVPLILDLLPEDIEKEVVKRAKDELEVEEGALAVSKKEANGAYHARVWGLTTYWYIWALLKVGELEHAKDVLENYLKHFDELTLFAIPETFWNGKALGASSQLWSSAWLPHIFDWLEIEEAKKNEGADTRQ